MTVMKIIKMSDLTNVLDTIRLCTAHLTRHIFLCYCTTDLHAHRVAQGSSRKFGVRTSHSMSHLHALMLCV